MREASELPFLAVKKNQIDIRAMVQLTATKFPQRKNGELSGGRTNCFAQTRIPIFVDFCHTNLGNLRQLCRRFFQWSCVRQLAQRNASHLPIFPSAQRPEIGVCNRLTRFSPEIIEHLSVTARTEANLRS